MCAQDIEDACQNSNLKVPDKGSVLIWTGHYEKYYGGNFSDWLYKYLGLSEEAMNWLADRGCVNVEIDSPSVD